MLRRCFYIILYTLSVNTALISFINPRCFYFGKTIYFLFVFSWKDLLSQIDCTASYYRIMPSSIDWLQWSAFFVSVSFLFTLDEDISLPYLQIYESKREKYRWLAAVK